MSKAITLYADRRERREQVAIGLPQERADRVPVGLRRLRVAQRRRFCTEPRGVRHRLAPGFVQQRVLVGDERADLLWAVAAGNAPRDPPGELCARDVTRVEAGAQP